MGHGSYTSADWSKLKASSGISERSTASQIFKKTKMEERFDPKYINIREARDSEDHPNSTPIIIGLDVTGSMGYLSEAIAKNALHETMMKLYSTKPVSDPQLMFAAIGDVTDDAPLQVTQFESDIRIAEQLLSLWLEGAGADAPEDFELLWYFAAKHTSIDSFEKRGKKGFLFTIGDADCHTTVMADKLEKIFGEHTSTYSSTELANMAMEKYEVFHISLTNSDVIPANFNRAIPGKVILLNKNDVNYIPEIIISTMQLINGMSEREVLDQWSDLARPIVKKAVEHLTIKKKGLGFFF
ncbi:MAG: hypothetical protein K6F75_01535 [Butyrivibrio sp.]|nr:hypothetical protein [Butyrivibrio sp.]